MSPAVPISLTCARCGRRASWSRRRGRYVHAAGGPVAACDLDSEHPVQPDWAAVGQVPCAVCGSPVSAAETGFSHIDVARDRQHAADPGFPRPRDA